MRRVEEKRKGRGGMKARKSGEEEGLEEGRKERRGEGKREKGERVAKGGEEKRIREGVE